MILILLIFLQNLIFSQDTTFVKKEDLEKGWGFYATNKMWAEIEGEPKTYIYNLDVSPDGKYLAYHSSFGFEILNLETKEKTKFQFGTGPEWCSDSKHLLYHHTYGGYFWNVETGDTMSLCVDKSRNCDTLLGKCSLGYTMGPDMYKYYHYSKGPTDTNSKIYKTNLLESFKIGCPVYEEINIVGKILYGHNPYMSMIEKEYFLTPDGIFYDGDRYHAGIRIVKDNNFENARSFLYNFDSTWVNSSHNTFYLSSGQKVLLLSTDDIIYRFLNFRSKSEIESFLDPDTFYDPVLLDSDDIEARNACGWIDAILMEEIWYN